MAKKVILIDNDEEELIPYTELATSNVAGRIRPDNSTVTVDGNGVLSVNGVTGAELGYLSGVTSSIQAQINNGQNDGFTITKNNSNKLQAVGIINQNATTTAIKTWTGTKAQYDAITTKDNNTLYHITDDESDIYDRVSGVINRIYPIGSIYLTVSNDNPATLLGLGTWQKVASGRVLQGSDNDHTAGTTIEAGLPNITGKFTQSDCQVGTYNAGANGAFYMTYENRGYMYGRMNSSENKGDLGFDASLSNSIYGNSNTVQPPAFVVNIWQRVA